MKRERGCRAKNSDIPSRNEEFAPEGFQRVIGKPFGGALGRAPSSKEPMIPPSCFMECSFRIRLIPPFLRGKDPIPPVQRGGKAFGLEREARQRERAEGRAKRRRAGIRQAQYHQDKGTDIEKHSWSAEADFTGKPLFHPAFCLAKGCLFLYNG